jgi:hypothetical protein
MPTHMAELSRQVILHLSVIAARSGYLELATLCTGSLLAHTVPTPTPTTGRGAKSVLIPGRGRRNSGSTGQINGRSTGSSLSGSAITHGSVSAVDGSLGDDRMQKEAQRDMHAIRVRRDALQARAVKAAAKSANTEKRRAVVKKKKDVVQEEASLISERSESEQDDGLIDDDAVSEVHTHKTGQDMDVIVSVGNTYPRSGSPSSDKSHNVKSHSLESFPTHSSNTVRLFNSNLDDNIYYANKRQASELKARYVKRRRVMPPGECHSCGTIDSPEWRKGPDGPKTLCNSCGLQWVKMSKRSLVVKIGIGSLKQVTL